MLSLRADQVNDYRSSIVKSNLQVTFMGAMLNVVPAGLYLLKGNLNKIKQNKIRNLIQVDNEDFGTTSIFLKCQESQRMGEGGEG